MDEADHSVDANELRASADSSLTPLRLWDDRNLVPLSATRFGGADRASFAVIGGRGSTGICGLLRAARIARALSTCTSSTVLARGDAADLPAEAWITICKLIAVQSIAPAITPAYAKMRPRAGGGRVADVPNLLEDLLRQVSRAASRSGLPEFSCHCSSLSRRQRSHAAHLLNDAGAGHHSPNSMGTCRVQRPCSLR